jgi:hypothetical protein
LLLFFIVILSGDTRAFAFARAASARIAVEESAVVFLSFASDPAALFADGDTDFLFSSLAQRPKVF